MRIAVVGRTASRRPQPSIPERQMFRMWRRRNLESALRFRRATLVSLPSPCRIIDVG